MMAAAIIVALAFFALAAYARYCKRDARRLHQYKQFADVFFESAHALVRADDAPEVAVKMVLFIARKVTDRNAAWQFLWMLLRQEEPNDAAFAHPIYALLKSNPELGKLFLHAMASGLLAIALNGGLAGVFMRRLVLRSVRQHEDRALDVAASLHLVEGAQTV